jgi:hypothetical protein
VIFQALSKCLHSQPPFRVTVAEAQEHADVSHPFTLLHTCRERLRSRRAADQFGYPASVHSMTSSASGIDYEFELRRLFDRLQIQSAH